MPKIASELSARGVQAIKSEGMHAVGGIPGLYLQIAGNARTWILRASVNSKRREIGLGSCAEVSLAEAREKARSMRAQVAAGVDPLEERRQARAAVRKAPMTFQEAAKRLIQAKAPEWKNAKHEAQWTATLTAYAFPTIGKTPVDQITLSDVVTILSPLWLSKTETATRLRARIEAVLSWATASGYRTGDNPARWRGNLDAGILPKPGKIKKAKHHAALPIDEVPAFMETLRGQAGMGARALEFAILTAARSQEVRGATWDEIDLTGATWTIPATRMKAGKEHKVPLSSPAVALLRALPRFDKCELVFPSSKEKQLSDMTLSAVVRRMKVDAVPHGFRSSFRDWASERTSYAREVSEKALAHVVGDKVEAAYRRGDLFAKRSRMMSEWARFLVTPVKEAGTVSPIRSARK